MAAVEEPKKPASAYFVYVNATRKAVQEELGETAFGPVTKVQAERWKTMGDGEKAKYEKQAADLKAKYDEELKSYKEAGGVVGEKRKEKRDAKKAKADKATKKEANADRPKRPAGGAFGVWLNKHRAEIMKSLPAGSKCTAVAPVASARWKALSEAEKVPFEKEYSELKVKFETEYKAWKEKAGQEEEDEEEEGEEEEQKESAGEASPKKKASPKKRSAPASNSEQLAASAKKAKGSGKKAASATPQEPLIDAEVMKQAKALNMGGPLTILAARQDVSHFAADKLLAALKTSGGLVNKARASLLGA